MNVSTQHMSVHEDRLSGARSRAVMLALKEGEAFIAHRYGACRRPTHAMLRNITDTVRIVAKHCAGWHVL